ncbi:MAG: hypothetical protein R3D99_09385 [Altererythrobacter sp.]
MFPKLDNRFGPISLSFDLYYQWEQGMWKLVGIDLQPVEMSTGTPAER